MKLTLKLAGCWLAYFLSLLFFAWLIRILHIPMQGAPGHSTAQAQFLLSLLGGVVLVAGLFPLARQLTGSALQRMVSLAVFLFLAMGVNTLAETSIFTDLFEGNGPGMVFFYQSLTLFLAVSLGLSFGCAGSANGFPRRDFFACLGRGAAAWLVWPVIYLFFGMLVAPIVVPYYRGIISWLHIPPMGVILGMQLMRSLIFLASSLPLIALWKGSRRGLWLALGLAHAAVVGLYGVVGSDVLPAILRIAHGAEITCDSFAYAGVLVLLFALPAKSPAQEPAQ